MSLGTKLRDYDEDHTRNVAHGKRKKRKQWLHRVDVDDFLDAMECLNVSRATADERLFSCPFPGHTHGDTRPSAYMNDGSKDESKATVWKCHGCGRSGNAISFYAEIENVSKQEAARHLREQYAPDFRQPRGGAISSEFEMRLNEREQAAQNRRGLDLPVIPYERYAELFAVDWYDAWQQTTLPDCPLAVSYMFDRGFTADTLTAWDIGYDDITDRITIPVRNALAQIVGVKARTWKPKQQEKIKYLILGDKEGRRARYGWAHYEKSRVLFGIDKCHGESTIVLVEGELDVIACWQAGIAAVATGGAALSRTQAILLRDQAEEVIVFYDSNNAGWEGAAAVIADLQPFMRVRVVEDHDSDASQLVQDGKAGELDALIDRAVSSFRLGLD